jgi:hypothetical protein
LQEKPLGDGEVAELRVRRDELVRSLREATDKVDAMERSMENERKHKIGLALSRQVAALDPPFICRSIDLFIAEREEQCTLHIALLCAIAKLGLKLFHTSRRNQERDSG